MARCYDPRRMSSAPVRIPPIIGRVLRGVMWIALLAVLAASAAGLVGEAWHAPGSPARAELTWNGDTALGAQLDAATDRLRGIANTVEGLATEAKTALEEVASVDPSRLQAAIQRGGDAARSVEAETRSLRAALADLPGDGPTAALEYSNATLVRRAAIIAAAEAAATLPGLWLTVTARSADAANLNGLITQHDTTVLDAAERGRNRLYDEAAAILDGAFLIIGEIQALRARLITSTEPTVLDEWAERNRDYDVALQNLYRALDASDGELTIEVQSARREERAAFDQLPPDRRTIVVILAEVARGGLTQAVIGIEDARGHIDEALAEADATIQPHPSQAQFSPLPT
jgi:hypothetical protein